MELNLFLIPDQVEMQEMLPENSEERTLFAQLSHEPCRIDDIIRTSTLLMMELRRHDQVGGGCSMCWEGKVYIGYLEPEA